MTTYRLPSPSADTAAILPCKSGGMSGPTATFAQSGGSKVSPSGSFRADSNLGSIALSLISATLNSGPKLDFTPETLAISALSRRRPRPVSEQPASTHTDAIANATFNIVANLPKPVAQLRNVDTVLTSRSAANWGGSAGNAEPGSVVSVVNA